MVLTAAKALVQRDPRVIWQEALAKGVDDPGLIIAVADYLGQNEKFDHVAEFLKANINVSRGLYLWQNWQLPKLEDVQQTGNVVTAKGPAGTIRYTFAPNKLDVAITNATESGTTVTITTSSATGFVVGQAITVQGVTPTGYDGTFLVTAIPTANTFTYTANAGFTGTDSFAFEAADGLNASAPATVTLLVSAAPPSADDGTGYSYAVAPGGTLTTTSDNGVLSAATDPYGYALTATA